MTDWSLGGWTGSINGWVRREVRTHLRENPVARRARYSLALQGLRAALRTRSLTFYVLAYLVLALCVTALEYLIERGLIALPNVFVIWGERLDVALLSDIASTLISAQVGALGVISLAIGLVTIIAQRDDARTDVQVYYHESLAFEAFASSIALLAVLCFQLIWPLQIVLYGLGEGANEYVSKAPLVAAHVLWLSINLCALFHFVVTTFQFVQQSARERMRESYIANQVLRHEMTTRLRPQLYRSAGSDIIKGLDPATPKDRKPVVSFGQDFGDPDDVEIERAFASSMALTDVRMLWVQWVATRWAARCLRDQPGKPPISGLRHMGPFLSFPVDLDAALKGKRAWCCRRGGVPLTHLERLVLRCAFRFARRRDEA